MALADLSPTQIVNRLVLAVMRTDAGKLYANDVIARVVGATSRAILEVAETGGNMPTQVSLAVSVACAPDIQGLPEQCVADLFSATLEAWAELVDS